MAGSHVYSSSLQLLSNMHVQITQLTGIELEGVPHRGTELGEERGNPKLLTMRWSLRLILLVRNETSNGLGVAVSLSLPCPDCSGFSGFPLFVNR